MQLPVCLPMNISALSSQVSFFDVMSYRVVKGVIFRVKIDNMTDGILPLPIGIKINTTRKGHYVYVYAYICILCVYVCI